VDNSKPSSEQAAFESLQAGRVRLENELGKVIVGQRDVVEQLMLALIAGGHCLITGAPGLAKTLLVKTIAGLFQLHFQRIQFTPDLMPADITGTEILTESDQGRKLTFIRGPIFANIVLADEINRTPPKTQAALLEAMQEHQVTAAGVRHTLSEPFFVLATQNPVEMEGTYPLPLAQLDRFMFKLKVDYPSPEAERRVLAAHHATSGLSSPERMMVERVMGAEEILAARQVIRDTFVREEVIAYVQRLLQATRDDDTLEVGASPRSGLMLLVGAKSLARFRGRDYVTPDDIQEAFLPALRHRVVLSPNVELEGTAVDEVLSQILELVEVPR
jgi:MoxR-like ATPase